MIFIHPDNRWRLSGHDVKIIEELKEVVRWWLPALTETDDIAWIVDLLRDLEGLESGHPPSQSCEFTVSRLDESQGGTSATIIVSSDQITLSFDEWVPNVNGTLDSGPILDRDGQPIGLSLERMGSFDRDRFDQWWFNAMDTGPGEPRDQTVKGSVSVED